MAGAYATVLFSWHEATSTLAIGAYKGSGFPGRLATRTFRLVRVRPGHGVGYEQTANPDKLVQYSGNAMNVSLP